MKDRWDFAYLPLLFFLGLWISDACMAPLWTLLFGPVREITTSSNFGIFELYLIQMSGLTIIWTLFALAHRVWRPSFYSGALRPLIFPIFNVLGAVMYNQLWTILPIPFDVFDEAAGDTKMVFWYLVTGLSVVFPIPQIVIYYVLRWKIRKAALSK